MSHWAQKGVVYHFVIGSGLFISTLPVHAKLFLSIYLQQLLEDGLMWYVQDHTCCSETHWIA